MGTREANRITDQKTANILNSTTSTLLQTTSIYSEQTPRCLQIQLASPLPATWLHLTSTRTLMKITTITGYTWYQMKTIERLKDSGRRQTTGRISFRECKKSRVTSHNSRITTHIARYAKIHLNSQVVTRTLISAHSQGNSIAVVQELIHFSTFHTHWTAKRKVNWLKIFKSTLKLG